MKLILSPTYCSRHSLQALSGLRVEKLEIAVDETYRGVADTELALAVYVYGEGRVFRFHGDALRVTKGRDYPSVQASEILSDRMIDESVYRSKIREINKFHGARVSVAEIWRATEYPEIQPITSQRGEVHFISGYLLFAPNGTLAIEASEFEPSLSIVENPLALERLTADADRLVLIR